MSFVADSIHQLLGNNTDGRLLEDHSEQILTNQQIIDALVRICRDYVTKSTLSRLMKRKKANKKYQAITMSDKIEMLLYLKDQLPDQFPFRQPHETEEKKHKQRKWIVHYLRNFPLDQLCFNKTVDLIERVDPKNAGQSVYVAIQNNITKSVNPVFEINAKGFWVPKFPKSVNDSNKRKRTDHEDDILQLLQPNKHRRLNLDGDNDDFDIDQLINMQVGRRQKNELNIVYHLTNRAKIKAKGMIPSSIKKLTCSECWDFVDHSEIKKCEYPGCTHVFHQGCAVGVGSVGSTIINQSHGDSKGKWYCRAHQCFVCHESHDHTCTTCPTSECSHERTFHHLRHGKISGTFCSVCMYSVDRIY
jgi:hypothetical protein